MVAGYPEIAYCHVCGASYGTSDRSGGHCRSCCQSFKSKTSFDAHRYGPHDGVRMCLTPEEMLADGWRQVGSLGDRWQDPKSILSGERLREVFAKKAQSEKESENSNAE